MISRDPRLLDAFRRSVTAAVGAPDRAPAAPGSTGDDVLSQPSAGPAARPSAIGLRTPGPYRSAAQALFQPFRPDAVRGRALRQACLYAPADAAGPISVPRGRPDAPRRVLLMRGWQHTTEAALPLKALVQHHVTDSVAVISTRAHIEGARQHLGGLVHGWEQLSDAERWEKTSAVAFKQPDSMNARARA
ncbi:MAG TPA: hypothetical protein VFH51_16345, partial [Myxococcota bacterium]|nr:hypothetical protein [Myxococcota bacterium]